jgi:molybdopterin/thiamine biosynthesis adenylyltransferase
MLPPDTSGISLSPDEVARFSRHLILPEVGMEGQKRLKAASVLCVGTGGLGSPLLLYLAAAGVGRLGIVDFDVVDHSNLQRQVIHGTSWVGKPKIESAKARILEINPHCQVDLYETALTSENALEIIAGYDLVCDGTDNFPTRYLVNDACVLLGKPNVYGSIFRFEGQATVFNLKAESPNYRDLFPEPPPPGMVPSCAEGGVVGVLPGIIGGDPGHRGREDHHRHWHHLERPAAAVRCPGDEVPGAEIAAQSRAPRDRQTDRLPGILWGGWLRPRAGGGRFRRQHLGHRTQDLARWRHQWLGVD